MVDSALLARPVGDGSTPEAAAPGPEETSEQPPAGGGEPVEPQDGAPCRDDTRYRLVDGTELIGQYQDAGYEVPKFLIRRVDGQVMQLPGLLYRVAASLDGRTAADVAAALSAELPETVSGQDVCFLVEERLRPVGIIAVGESRPGSDADGRGDAPEPPPVRSDPLLALRYRVGVVPAAVCWRIAGVFRPMFARPVWISVLLAFLTLDVLVVRRGSFLDQVTAGVLQVVRHPVLVLVVLGLGMFSAAFHECGHVTACRYGGARPGDMGVGLYIVWPAFYSTVTDSYRLSRVGRLRTDLGGVYFNTVVMVGLAATYLQTGTPWLLVALLTMFSETAYQFFPSLRLDGYYILADLVGVPDLFCYVGPVLSSALPGRPVHPRVHELRPWTRRIMVLWVVLSIPTLLFGLVVFLIAAPRIVPLLGPAVLAYAHTLDTAVRSGDVVTAALGVLQLFFLVLPWVGTALIAWSFLTLLGRLALRRWGGGRVSAAARAAASARLRHVLALVSVTGLAAAVVVRVATVAGSLPASAGEGRLVGSALAAVSRAPSGPSVGPADYLAREQLVWYARLTGAFSRHASAVAGARELAVLSTAVLVLCLLTAVFARRLRLGAAAVTLAAGLLMGPVISILATVSPGVLAAAWTSAGVLVLGWGTGRIGAAVGGLAVGVGVLTAPVIAVPLAAAAVVALAGGRLAGSGSRSTPRHAGADPRVSSRDRWLLVALVLPLAAVLPYFGADSGDQPLDRSVRSVVLVVGALVVAAAWRECRLRPATAAAGAAVLLAALPWPGAGVALGVAVVAVAWVAALLHDTGRARPAAERAHPLLRALVAVPVLLLVVVGALFLPAAAPRPPVPALSSWIRGPASNGGVVAVPASLWGELVRDGVPPARLALAGSSEADQAGWSVGPGGPGQAAPAATTFGAGPGALTVTPSVRAVREQQRRSDGQRQAVLERRADEEQRRAQAAGAALGAVLADDWRIQAPPDVLAVMRQGAVDGRALAVLADLARQGHVVALGAVGSGGAPVRTGDVATELLVSAVDGMPASDQGVSAGLTQWLKQEPVALQPVGVVGGGSGVTLSWNAAGTPPGRGW